jgi:Na+(H+)/acetate symporter ActP
MDIELLAGIAILAYATGWTIHTLTLAFIVSKDLRRG